ncbi:F-box domain-containing protein [Caenorhabditis elegans]|uniref:F-box domain-containing protein n=1 Tax=Caenorhabditis elegans TaxID=6239 RepID=Q20225_CAEEL|nr:F-box domain-containing protein [Caenorhabditis elegans]CCD70140.2 F-box domain-containing protein [Caenorhabditis elegans]|eukprot:NP_001309501.1 F-box B protein [Caenorhabditis elegans]
MNILQLPSKALRCTLQHCDLLEILNFSFVSKKTKQFAKSLHRNVSVVEIDINDFVEVQIWKFEVTQRHDRVKFTFFSNMHRSLPVEDPQFFMDQLIHNGVIDGPEKMKKFGNGEHLKIQSSTTGRVIWMSIPSMGLRKYVDHLLDVLNRVKLDEFAINKDNYCTESICDEFRDFDIRCFMNPRKMSDSLFHQKIMRHIASKCDSLDLCTPVFEPKTHTTQEFLIQNFDALRAMYLYKYNLNDILSTNIFLVFGQVAIDSNQLNLFVRHWIKGSNPRLEYFQIDVPKGMSVEDDLSVILDKVDFQKQPDSFVRDFPLSVQGYDQFIPSFKNRIIKGGVDIKRANGSIATLKYCITDSHLRIRMFIFNDDNYT